MDFDILVAGAGPAGLASAITVAQHTRWKVAILERSGKEGMARIGESAPGGLRALLHYLGVWERVCLAGAAAPSLFFSAWGSPVVTTAPVNPGQSLSRLSIRRPQFDKCLRERAAELGIVFIPWMGDRRFRPGENGWTVVRQDNTAEGILTRWLIDATGKSAAIARRFCDRQTSDRLAASVCVLDGLLPGAPEQMLLEAVEQGWWYAASLPGGRTIAAFLSDPDILHSCGALTADGWFHALEATCHLRILQSAQKPGSPPALYSAASQISVRREPVQLVAAGEAAASFDPLSSMGISFALQSGIEAARACAAALAGSPDAHARHWAATARIFDEFRQNQRAHYQSEQRWVDSLFWRRRNSRRRGSESCS